MFCSRAAAKCPHSCTVTTRPRARVVWIAEVDPSKVDNSEFGAKGDVNKTVPEARPMPAGTRSRRGGRRSRKSLRAFPGSMRTALVMSSEMDRAFSSRLPGLRRVPHREQSWLPFPRTARREGPRAARRPPFMTLRAPRPRPFPLQAKFRPGLSEARERGKRGRGDERATLFWDSGSGAKPRCTAQDEVLFADIGDGGVRRECVRGGGHFVGGLVLQLAG